MAKSSVVTILSTAAPGQAPAIAKMLVERRLVACVNIQPVRSIYRWKGRTLDEGESLMIMKSRKENTDAVIAAIKKEHSYEVPEIIVLPVIAGYAPYLDWVRREAGPA
ncbi:MAG TPA: divalent-cation tolerance protein CutA [Methanoregulaceae archaeon]|nr:divalent-cation tolerance protein CutA [Methanoregulaceae archaeon]HPD75426.1 divalent-cation tolerance protein CutA [Methanoregulaceae archaeon]HRY75044.1 divalent-cation tolerance protein CutA [Methanoregulaceae archaeon]